MPGKMRMSSGPRPYFVMRACMLVAEGAAFRDRVLRGEHHVGGAGGELHADVGRAGLRHHRPALRRARDVERPAHVEVLPLVIEDVHLVVVEPDAAFLVAQEGVVLPAVPQADHDVVELRGAVVADAVLEMLVAAEIKIVFFILLGFVFSSVIY